MSLQSDRHVVAVELYACNGHYAALHDEPIEGCGTVFAPGTGPDDLFERTVEYDDGMTDTYTVKDYCPVCNLENVVAVKILDGVRVV